MWLVEYPDAREPGSRFQAGAFTTEAEAQRLLDQSTTVLGSNGHASGCAAVKVKPVVS